MTALAWAIHGARLIAATADGKVRIIDAAPRGMTELSSIDVPSSDPVRAVTSSDDDRKIAIGTSSGAVSLAAVGGVAQKLAELHAPVGCIAVAYAGRAVVASADRRVSVIDGDTSMSFLLWTTTSPVVQCARSPGVNRFSFVDEDGAIWLKALDLAGVADSYVPTDPAVPAAVPTLARWKGLPVGLVP